MKSDDSTFQDLASEMKQRFEKVQQTLDEAGDMITDDVISFVTLYLAALKKADPALYNIIIHTVNKIDVEFKKEGE
jgi:hypothetical protein